MPYAKMYFFLLHSCQSDQKSVYENPAAKSEIFFISDDQYFLPNANPLDMAQFYRNYYSGFDMARFLEMIGKFGLSRRRKINTFSKGMKRQAFLILALCSGTKYLLCDEVFDGLDPVMRQTVKSLIAKQILCICTDTKQHGHLLFHSFRKGRELPPRI